MARAELSRREQNAELFQAISKGDLCLFNNLLASGADPNGVNRRGISPLNFLIDTFPTDVEHFLVGLLRSGADVNGVDSSGYSPLEKVLRKSYHFQIENIVTILLESGATVSILNAIDKPKIVELLLRHGANPNVQNARGETPMHFAVLYKKPELVELLLRHGADPNVQSARGETPLDIASRQDYETSSSARTIRQLLEIAVMPAFKSKSKTKKSKKSKKKSKKSKKTIKK